MTHEPNNVPHATPPRGLKIFGLVLLTVAVVVVVNGLVGRVNHEKILRKAAETGDVVPVDVIMPAPGPALQALTLPGTVKPYFEAPIYSRIAGYLKRWHTDIGAKVKAGQLLAEIETPELDQQILRAQADLATAEANLELATSTAKRWRNLLASDSVSKQEVDEKTGDAKAKKALADSARASLDSLRAQQVFNRIVAPFDGVITDRKTDVGKLVNPGSSNGQELFRVADVHKLRVYVEVPQNYSALIKPDLTAELRFPEHPSKPFPATLVATSGAVNEASRTLTVELETDNAAGELLAGTYVEAHFKLPSTENVLRLPASALLFRKDGMEVATVGPGDRVVLKQITIGRDLGTVVEVTSGIEGSDQIIDSPSDSFAQGDVVRVVGHGSPFPETKVGTAGSKP